MVIYPAIDMKDNSCVRLTQGVYEKMTVYEKDPVKVAKRWETMGAEILHLVDLDGAKNGIRVNEPVVKEILKNINIPVQLGGGIRDTQGVKTLLDLGVSQVIIGTVALKNPAWIKEMIQTYGKKIIVSIDAINGLIATDGWQEVSDVKALDYIKQLKSYGLNRIVYTDIEKDGMLIGPNFKIYEELAQNVDIEVIASGGVTTLEDIKKLKVMGLYGAIVGKALYDGKLDLEEVLKCQ
ncbi:1-(5-phosphoribosyl)-5-[(5-phosphoribosylamino)methylideneamino]imidazole-4-carboxamide isomerase [Tissierella creatinophila]|uniref:1-(5-phosphoribosyl)-5-[(5-phosphoribosylamino)methylideneamino] imidazole-4-carboxamide isomerase n=1 Tax=Tissierella creatinophila DSM 6911 TaxID=1123403 RepID=A0A1U7M7B1_TISCR|nr:1-(5-phosphoribosyl)-5-[(5-phosphoribosylamino)methylideneamino]imidazole-4-carboxamide isomerase [Tissierella creatinophila]OLS03187.1 1-(5-phosphoribosyl)-5-[(5-phosphoribosylamino)methylideneamino] imidazole-4-carboxamide isomerase [Tissierella creatinophila DSM 6911]